MPFIPHTETDVAEMLKAIGAPSTEALFGDIPAELRCKGLDAVPERISEMEIAQLMRARAAADGGLLNFCGAGAYEHHIPAAVWEITTRGEFYSAYTPYQAEASQGTLQLLYEFQSMMCALTGMDVSNASLYDGASALAEAVLMAVRANPKEGGARVLLPLAVHPYYREVVSAIVEAQGIELVDIAFDAKTGKTDFAALKAAGDATAVVIPQPNFFGVLEDVDAMTDHAHAIGALAIGVVNPLSLAVLKPGNEWGGKGTDIVCGDGQPLGVPLASGGPYYGFLTARQAFVRQMPGRIVGRTVDMDGKPGFALTLQAREQHIRRSKATSNICTNQGLLVTASTIHMSLLGAEGLSRVASHSIANTNKLVDALTAIEGVETIFASDRFHEAVLRLPKPVAPILETLSEHGIFGGFDLSRHYPQLGQAVLVCATETRTDADIAAYARALATALKS